MISLRAYDQAALMLAAEVCAGTDVGARLDALFADPRGLRAAAQRGAWLLLVPGGSRRHGTAWRISTT
jgi:hypothetical protein